MILFKATGHKNYAIEAFSLLAQHKWFLPPCQAMQLMYSRFINVHGRIGHNVPCDLHMEHLNRVAKLCVQQLGANKTGKSIQRIGKCVGAVDKILQHYDQENDITTPSIHHSIPSSKEEKCLIIDELLKNEIFTTKPGCKHTHFKNFTCNIMRRVNKNSMEEWMNTQLGKLIDLIGMQR